MSGNKAKGSRMSLVIRILMVAAVLLVGIVAYMGYIVWCDCREVFQDVTVELGTESLSLRDFMTENARGNRASFVSDPSEIDISQTGQTRVTLKHGFMTYTVVLTVQDTQAPAGDILQEYAVSLSQGLPEAAALVSNIQDASEVRISYAQEPVIPEDYSDIDVTIVLEDESGNKTEQTCRFHFSGWLKKSAVLELGQTLTPEMLLANPEKDLELLKNAIVDDLDTVGEHTITVPLGNTQERCVVTVQDTVAPELELKTVRRMPGETLELQDFVVSVSDLSGEPEVRVAGELPDCSEEGTYTIKIEAEDTSGNLTSKETTLWVSSNLNPPVIEGAEEELSIEKHSTPDFLEGVKAKDDVDDTCEVTVDTSALDSSAAGTYYITYSATDSSGNVATYKRKVVVEPNEEDTAQLVKEIADTLPDDPESIRDYVHDNIAYSSNWGGDDPIWHGFTLNSGNCNVHARCLQALLEEKGYETQLIWVTNKSHYWVIVKLDEGWRHIDSTPSEQHEKIGLATDRVRYLNLNGRNWDRSKWPACN